MINQSLHTIAQAIAAGSRTGFNKPVKAAMNSAQGLANNIGANLHGRIATIAYNAALRGSSFFTYSVPKGMIFIGNNMYKFVGAVWKMVVQAAKFVAGKVGNAINKTVGKAANAVYQRGKTAVMHMKNSLNGAPSKMVFKFVKWLEKTGKNINHFRKGVQSAANKTAAKIVGKPKFVNKQPIRNSIRSKSNAFEKKVVSVGLQASGPLTFFGIGTLVDNVVDRFREEE